MSISVKALNDLLIQHENRIKALENRPTSTTEIQTLWSGFVSGPSNTITLNSSDDKYNFIEFLSKGQTSANYISMIISKEHLIERGVVVECANRWLWLRRESSTVYKVFNASNGEAGKDGISAIVGLKLYYNFSYNIHNLANHILFHFSKYLMS